MSSLFSTAWGILMVALFFGGSIFIHELGHFLAAKWRGLQIDRFSIGFGPKIVEWKRNGIEYRLSWLPLGGYVALPQLADMRGIEGESENVDSLPPISYTDKVIVAVAGAVFNVLLAFALATLLYFTGLPSSEQLASTKIGHVSESVTNAEGNDVPAPAFAAGLQVGDTIKFIDGTEIRSWENIHQAIALGYGIDHVGRRSVDFTVERDGELKELEIHPVLSQRDQIRQVGIRPAYTGYVNGVYPNSPAEAAGIQAKDILVAVDGIQILNPQTYYDYITTKENTPVTLTLERDGETFEKQVIPVSKKITKNGETRIMTGIYALVSAPSLIHKTPWEQIQGVAKMTISTLRSLTNRNSDIKVKQMSGPVDIARIIFNLAQFDMLRTVWFALVINVSLAFFNLLPIPVLDGGHIVFATITKLRSKAINPNIIASIQGSFMVLLFGMMLYITFFNVTRWSKDTSEQQEYKDEAIPVTFEAPTES